MRCSVRVPTYLPIESFPLRMSPIVGFRRPPRYLQHNRDVSHSSAPTEDTPAHFSDSSMFFWYTLQHQGEREEGLLAGRTRRTGQSHELDNRKPSGKTKRNGRMPPLPPSISNLLQRLVCLSHQRNPEKKDGAPRWPGEATAAWHSARLRGQSSQETGWI